MKKLTKTTLALFLTFTSLSALANYERITCSGYPDYLSIRLEFDSNNVARGGGIDNFQHTSFENCERKTSQDGYTLLSVKCLGKWSATDSEISLHIERAQNGMYAAKFNRGIDNSEMEIGCIVER